MTKAGTTVLILALALLLPISCSKSNVNPVSENITAPQVTQTTRPDSTNMWGLWNIFLNPDTNSAEIVPLRTADFTMNMVKYLQPPEVPDNQIEVFIDTQTKWYSGYVVVDVTLHHPFPNHDFATGFDVRGVLMGNGSNTSSFDPTVKYSGANDLVVYNPDGYSRWFNASEFTSYNTLFGFTELNSGTQSSNWTATINPYKLFCDGIDATGNPGFYFGESWWENPRAYFYPKSTLKRRYIMQFPVVDDNPVYEFQFACVANWAMPSPNPPVNIPEDFPANANASEAFAARVLDSSDMYYVDESTNGGDLVLLVTAFDHQGDTNPNGVAGEIGAVHVESPDGIINGGHKSYTGADLEQILISNNEFSATYAIKISDITLSGNGWYPFLVAIESVSPDNYFSGDDQYVYPADAKLTAYFMGTAKVDSFWTSKFPEAWAEIVGFGPFGPGDPIELDASGSFDPDGGLIENYEWDLNNDGVYGDTYDSGTDSHPVISFDSEGTYPVNLRVTDDEGDTAVMDYPLDIFVGPGQWDPWAIAKLATYPPFNAGNPIDFDASESKDLDGGDIVSYEWDFNGDGIYGDTYDSGTDIMPTVIFSVATTYIIDLKVTDDEGATDVLDFPFSLGIGDTYTPPVAYAQLKTNPPYHVGTLIEFDAFFSKDEDGGPIVSYEWDFDGDGIYGDSYTSGTDSNPVIQYASTGTFSVDLRVTDNEGETDTLDVPVDVNITENVAAGWARNAGGPMWDYAYDMAVDSNGNTIITGEFEGTADFDPGPGEALLTATGLWDIFLLYLDADGNYVWAYSWGSDWGEESGMGVAFDHEGNAYITGTYEDTIDFDPGPDIENHPAYGYPDAFLIKFTPDGTYQWTKTWGGSSLEILGLNSDANGKLYVTGSFFDTIDFNPNSGTDAHTSGYWNDAFLMVMNSDGSYGWTQTWGGEGLVKAFDADTDLDGNVYIVGSFEETADFDPGIPVEEFTATNASDDFMLKLDETGSFVWVKVWGSNQPAYDTATGVSVNSSGVVGVTGYFYGSMDFDPGTGVDEKTSINYNDSFVSVFDTDGNYQWGSHWGGNSDSYPESRIFVSDSGKVLITGQFAGEVDFDPGAGEDLHNGIQSDAYLTTYDSIGTYLWTHTFGGGYVDWGESVEVDGSDNIYVGGTFFDIADFNPDADNYDHSSNGGSDAYVMKLLPDGTW